MDTFYHADERYLQAVEELKYGELPKALQYLNAIIDTDPDYARAHYQLGCIYAYHIKDHQTAGYYFKRCIALDPEFPDVYIHYIRLLIKLKMHKDICPAAGKALQVAGICESEIYTALGSYAETRQDWAEAASYYHKAALTTADIKTCDEIKDHVKRLINKQHAQKAVVYSYQE